MYSTGSDFKVRLWDAATGAPRGKALTHESFIYETVFSPDGKTVLTASWDKTARLLGRAHGRATGPALPAHLRGDVRELQPRRADDHDGRRGRHGSVHLWDVSWLAARPAAEGMLKDAEQVTLRHLNSRGDVETIARTP